jgi:hypothetical protein
MILYDIIWSPMSRNQSWRIQYMANIC